MLWLVAIVGAAASWGVSEIFSDVCVMQHEEEDSDESKKRRHQHAENGRPGTPDMKKKRHEMDVEASLDETKIAITSQEDINKSLLISCGKLSGEQSTFVSGITMLLCTIMLHAFSPVGPMATFSSAWWISVFAGIFNACAYFLLFKAYETAPSTVIVPLVQLTAVMMLFTSSFTSFLVPFFPDVLASEGDSFLTLRECVAYSVILVGGLLPAAHGNLSLFTSREFWRQPYVVFILGNDALLAIYYELMDICTSETVGSSPEQFMIVSCYAASFTFISMYLVSGRLRQQVRELGNVRSKYLLYCIASEILNWAAYWMATYAYHSHQANINIIGAAEVALSQVMNLLMATAMMYVLGIGRDSAVEGLGVKAFSCLCITIGIMLTISLKRVSPLAPRDKSRKEGLALTNSASLGNRTSATSLLGAATAKIGKPI
jgi:hypothetical protein